MLKKLIKFHTKDVKGVLSLLVGNTVSKLILTVGVFFLANYYGVDNYGIYASFLSYISIISVFATLSSENILIMLKDTKAIRNLFSGVFLISILIVFFLVSGTLIIKLINSSNLKLTQSLIILCGVGGILTAWNLTQNALFTKYKLFIQTSTGFVIGAFITIISQSFFLYFEVKETGLIYGSLLGLTISFFYYLKITKSRLSAINFQLVKQSIKQHIDIVKYGYLSGVINSIANNILPILILTYFTSQETGIYAMANKVLVTPVILLSSSFSIVFFQKSVSLYNFDKRKLLNLTRKIVLSNAGLVLIFLVLINTIGVYFIDFFLNKNWHNIELYILILSFWIIARSTVNPVSTIVMVIKKNHYSLIFNIYLLLVNFIAIYIGHLQENILYCLGVFSLFSGLGYFVLLYFIFKSLHEYEE